MGTRFALSVSLAIAVGGCAVAPEEYDRTTITELCMDHLTGRGSRAALVAMAEQISRRREDCSRFIPLATARMRVQAQADANYTAAMEELARSNRSLGAPQPQPYYVAPPPNLYLPPPPPSPFSSYSIGGRNYNCVQLGTHTSCN